MKHPIIIFDTEIKHQILTKPAEQDAARDAGQVFASSWTDYESMGVACLCAPTLDDCLTYRNADDLYARAMFFTESHLANAAYYFDQFALHASHNGDGFDAPLLAAHGVYLDPSKSFDLMAEWRRVTGARIGLDALAQANGVGGKTEDGANAPILWQRGEHSRVLRYCMNDCLMLALLLEKVINGEPLKHPKTGEDVRLRNPLERGGLF